MDVSYYLIENDCTPSVPLLMPDENQMTYMLHKKKPAVWEKPVELCYCPPIPSKPRMVDFHQMPSSVFSQKIYDVLHPMDIEGLQLIPATIRGCHGDLFENYWLANIYKRIACLDMAHSIYEISEIDGEIMNIMKFYLDREKLIEIPLEKRLVFLLAEDMPKRIYHQSVVDAIMAVNPEGVQFIPVECWHEGI